MPIVTQNGVQYNLSGPGDVPSSGNRVGPAPAAGGVPAPVAPTAPVDSNPLLSQVGAHLGRQVTNPALPPGTQHVGTNIQEQPGELVPDTTTGITPITQPTPTPVGQAQQVAAPTPFDAAQYDPSLATAVQGEVTQESTVQWQLSELYQQAQEGTAPWAAGAIRRANAEMQRRGLGSSTMALDAITQGVMEAAFPIAKADADTFGAVNIQNIRNRQEAMLTNVAAENAGKQFNSQSQNDINKFMSDLTDRTMRFNAEQQNAMSRFDVEQQNALDMFFDNLRNDSERFIANNQRLVSESNAEWRRTMNLANTATANATNQMNVQNRFNLSQQAVADLWQQARDAFHWINVTSENEKDRAFRLTEFALQRSDFLSDLDAANSRAVLSTLGGLAVDVFKPAATNFVTDLFSNNEADI